jgi:hypothetical protein
MNPQKREFCRLYINTKGQLCAMLGDVEAVFTKMDEKPDGTVVLRTEDHKPDKLL